MKLRWIIRGFFIGLLLLCGGGWGVSYRYGWQIADQPSYIWLVRCEWGEIHLIWTEWAVMQVEQQTGEYEDWIYRTFPTNSVEASAFATLFDIHYYLGFSNATNTTHKVVSIPFWFPTTAFSALLWLVWRKTRPKLDPKTAFPVEAKQDGTSE